MATLRGASTDRAGASLNTLPIEILTQILDEIVAEDLAQRSDRTLDETRHNRNLKSVLPLLLTSRRLSILAQERLYERVRLSRFDRIVRFADTVADAAEDGRNISVRDLGIDASQYSTPPQSKSGPVMIPVPPFLHVLSTLKTLSLNSFYGQDMLMYILEELPADLNLFPYLEDCRLICDAKISARALLPFWGAPKLKSLYLEDLHILSSDRDDGGEELTTSVNPPIGRIEQLAKLDLYHVALDLTKESLLVLTGLRTVKTLRTELMRISSSTLRSIWRELITALAPSIKHLACARQSLGFHPDEENGQIKPFRPDEIPPLGALTQATSLDITEQQLDFALCIHEGRIEEIHSLPPRIERLYVEVDSHRMHRLRLYAVLDRLLVNYRAGRLPKLEQLELFFRRNDGQSNSGFFNYSHEYIDLWEIEERGFQGVEGYEFPSGFTIEHGQFDRECKRLGLQVKAFSDIPVLGSEDP